METNPLTSRQNPRHPRLRLRVYPCLLSTLRSEVLKLNQNASSIQRLNQNLPDADACVCVCVCVCVFGLHYTLYCKHSLNSRFMTMDTDARAGLKMSLLVASQVNSAPSSDLKRSETATEEVTVLPEKTSDEEGRSRPLRSHNTDGRGRPDKNNLQKLANAF